MNLYRGLSEETWARLLISEYGWPEESARKMLAFLVGKGEMPRWMEMVE